MSKQVRYAVRTFLIKDNKVVCTKYKKNNIGFIDIPGGKIEDGETSDIAAVREFKEETGIIISDLEKIGTIIIEYPNRIYYMEELLQQDKRYAITYLLQPEFTNEFENKSINVKFLVNGNHSIIDYFRF